MGIKLIRTKRASSIASVLEAISDRNHPNRFKKAAPQAAPEGWSQTKENWAGGDELRTADARRR